MSSPVIFVRQPCGISQFIHLLLVDIMSISRAHALQNSCRRGQLSQRTVVAQDKYSAGRLRRITESWCKSLADQICLTRLYIWSLKICLDTSSSFWKTESRSKNGCFSASFNVSLLSGSYSSILAIRSSMMLSSCPTPLTGEWRLYWGRGRQC